MFHFGMHNFKTQNSNTIKLFMKLTFTKKLILEAIDRENESVTIRFVSYLKEDYIERLLKILIKNNVAVEMYFSSNDFGTAIWVKEKGIVDSHQWETDDSLRKLSYLSRHYPALLQNGEVSIKYAFEKIIPDVLENMIDLNLSCTIYKIINSPNENTICKWDEIINKNKELRDNFINELIIKNTSKVKKPEVLKKEKSISVEYNKLIRTKNIQIIRTIKKAIKFLSMKFNIIRDFLHDYYVNKKPEKQTTQKKSTNDDDIKVYLEKAKRFSKKIKKL